MPNEEPGGDSQPESLPVVGVIGLGAIGDGVAKSLLREGFPVVVCDVRSEATDPYLETATVAATPAELAGRSDVVVVAVVNDAQVHAVLSGPEGGLAAATGSDTTFLVVSTISTPCVAAIGAEAAALGVTVLDCGVTGGYAAATGELVCMVGGDPAVIERLGPVFDAISSLTITMGPFGSGLAAKLARNLITYGSWLAAFEGQQLAEAAGIPLAKLAEAVKASDVHIGGASRLMFRSTVTPFTDGDDQGLIDMMRTAASLAHKDLLAALELAHTLDVDLPLATMTEHRADEIFGLGETTP